MDFTLAREITKKLRGHGHSFHTRVGRVYLEKQTNKQKKKKERKNKQTKKNNL